MRATAGDGRMGSRRGVALLGLADSDDDTKQAGADGRRATNVAEGEAQRRGVDGIKKRPLARTVDVDLNMKRKDDRNKSSQALGKLQST